MNQVEHEAGYLRYLPPVFSEKAPGPSGYLAGMLKVFEQFFSGRPAVAVPLEELPPGLSNRLAEGIQYDASAKRLICRGEFSEELLKKLQDLKRDAAGYQNALTTLFQLSHSIRFLLDRMASYLDPQKTPEEFIGWLAERFGLRLREDWGLEKKRAVLAAVMPLYRIRGTRRGLEQYLRLYTGWGDLRVIDETDSFQVEESSLVEAGVAVEGLPPYFFIVEVEFPPDPVALKAKLEELTELIDQEKPAHTRYLIRAVVPSLRVEEQSTIEQDTLLWEWTQRRYAKEDEEDDNSTTQLF